MPFIKKTFYGARFTAFFENTPDEEEFYMIEKDKWDIIKEARWRLTP